MKTGQRPADNSKPATKNPKCSKERLQTKKHRLSTKAIRFCNRKFGEQEKN
jgi:hypothetical protein